MNREAKAKRSRKRWKRVLTWSVAVILVALLAWFEIAYWTSSNDCGYSAAPTNPMKAIVYCDYGLGNLKLKDIEKPVPNDDQVLVRVRAASVNPYDWHFVEGTPKIMRMMGVGLRKPKDTRLGVDFAGTVEAVGKNVTQFKPGDEVFGGRGGAFAEYVCPRATRAVAPKPANVTFEQAASVNIAGVCSTRNIDLVRSLGADHVIDYTKEDFAKSDQHYDVILDNVPNHSLSEIRRVLNPNGKYVLIGGGGPNDNRWIGPFGRVIHTLVLSPFINQKMGMMMADANQKDLTILADMMQTGKLKPVIDRTYKLDQVPDAIRYVEAGHARGKVIITVE